MSVRLLLRLFRLQRLRDHLVMAAAVGLGLDILSMYESQSSSD